MTLAEHSRITMAAMTLAFVVTTGCGEPARSWQIDHSRESAFDELEPRVEILLRDSWVGEWEDRFGRERGASSHDLRLARHCRGEWSITYPEDAVYGVEPGDGLQLWVQTHRGRLDATNEDAVWVAGSMASSGVTAVFQAAPKLDEALFVNGFVWLVVAKQDESMVSASSLWVHSRDADWMPGWMQKDTQLPDDLDGICGVPVIDRAPTDPEERQGPQGRRARRRR